jgi:hypothetical protein
MKIFRSVPSGIGSKIVGGGFMRLLTSSALLICLLAFAGGLFAAQSTPPSPTGQPAFQTPKPKQNTTAAHKHLNLVTQQNSDSMQMLEHRNFDKGIYAPTYADGKSICAAIMSYNFTPGDNPELKSVTTCTPARPNSVYRTDDENRKRPPTPSLLMISSPQSAHDTKGTSAR